MLNPMGNSTSDGFNQNHVVNPVIRNDAQNLVNQIAVRVEHGHAFAVFDVLPDEIEKQRDLPVPDEPMMCVCRTRWSAVR